MIVFRKFKSALRVWKLSGWRGVRRVTLKKLLAGIDLDSYETLCLANEMDFNHYDLDASQKVHSENLGALDLKSVCWFIPDFTHPYYGGIYTILRFAQFLKVRKGVSNHFVIVGNMPLEKARRGIAQAFPELADATIQFSTDYHLDWADATIATLWTTAYHALKFNATRRKFYFLQDYEALFYPAGSTHAQVEETYRFGFYGIANTPSVMNVYERQYGGKAEFFMPCVDTTLFHPDGRKTSGPPYTLFFYGRPGHPRNGFELGAMALKRLKKRMGANLQILCAGAPWNPAEYELNKVVKNLGLLSIQQTADLYRQCDAGLVMMFTRHPSYLPFELMASGALVVSNYNPATTWFLKDRENCLLSEGSATCLADTLEEALTNTKNRQQITLNALENIRTSYTDWEASFEKIYHFMNLPILPSS